MTCPTASLTLLQRGPAMAAARRRLPPLPPAVPGVAAALTAATIWGGALAMTRLGVSAGGSLGPGDIALLRFLGPALLLAPLVVRALPRLRAAGPLALLLILVGGGAPFVMLAGAGLREADAAEAGALLPGTVPLWVAVASALLGERFGRARLLGLACIGAAVALVAGPVIGDGEAGAWRGVAWLLGASALAAGYTLGLRRAGLGAWEAVGFVSLGSVAVLAAGLLLGAETRLAEAPPGEIAVQAVYQGAVSGLAAPLAFAVAVRRLGPARAAAFGGLSPAAATLFGVLLLGEAPEAATLAGVVAAGLGVALFSRERNAVPARVTG